MAPIQHGGALARAIEIYGGRKEDWLDLSTGINPNPPELPEIPLSIWNRLPDADLDLRARRAAAEWYLGQSAVLPDRWPVPVAGTQAFIQIMPRLWPEVQRAAIVHPTYGEYAHCLKRAGVEIDLVASLADIDVRHDLAIVVNPNNPDGRMWGRDELVGLATSLWQRGARLHVDEAFGDLDGKNSLAADASRNSGLTVSRSFGKFFGLAGARLGFVFAVPDEKKRLEEALGPWPVAGPALYLAAELMQSGSRKISEQIRERSAALRAVLSASGLSVTGHADLFSLVVHDEANNIHDHLARRHILIRKFEYAPTWLRFGLPADKGEDDRLRAALASFAGVGKI